MGISGQNSKLYANEFDITADFRDLGFERSVDEFDDTTFGQSHHTFMPTLKDGNINASGYWKGDEDEIDERLDSLFGVAGTLVSAFMDGDTLGSPGVLAKCMKSTYKIGSKVGGAVVVGIEIKPSLAGAVLSCKSLHAMGAETATGNGASVDNGAASTTGYTANLHVTDTAGDDPSTVVKVQHSSDDSMWADLFSFTAATEPTSEQKTGAGTVNRYTRAVRTLGADTDTITFAVTLARE